MINEKLINEEKLREAAEKFIIKTFDWSNTSLSETEIAIDKKDFTTNFIAGAEWAQKKIMDEHNRVVEKLELEQVRHIEILKEEFAKEIESLKQRLSVAVEALEFMSGGCLVPPDGGSPDVSDYIKCSIETLAKISAEENP